MAGQDARRTLRYGLCQTLLLFEVAGDPNDICVGTWVTLLGDLPPDLGGVATALLPASQDVVFVWGDGAELLREVASLGRGLESQVLLHGVAVYSEFSGYLCILHALLRKGVDRFEELLRTLSCALLRSLAVQAEVRQSLEGVHRSWHQVQNLGVLLEHPKNNVPQILQEVETVGNLPSVRSNPPRCFSVLATTIPANNLDFRMPRKPPGEGVRTPVGQNIHQFTSFEIHQNGSIAGPTTESEVIHAHYPGRLAIWEWHRTDVL